MPVNILVMLEFFETLVPRFSQAVTGANGPCKVQGVQQVDTILGKRCRTTGFLIEVNMLISHHDFVLLALRRDPNSKPTVLGIASRHIAGTEQMSEPMVVISSKCSLHQAHEAYQCPFSFLYSTSS